VRLAFAAMEKGDIIMYGGRRCVLEGFTPMSVQPPGVFLRDLETGERVHVLARTFAKQIEQQLRCRLVELRRRLSPN
jgi:hypothetical protein